jgi:hypothetical protein
MLRIRLFALFLLALLPLVGQAREELVDPGPVAVPAGLAAEKVAMAIKAALIGRTWTVAKESPGHIDATLYVRSHVARIAITYDAREVRIAYVGSDNLDYKEKNGKRYIHKNYLSWIGNLISDLSRHLQTPGL